MRFGEKHFYTDICFIWWKCIFYNLKKIFSILLLFLILMTGIHPALFMHFCSGKLHSFSLSAGTFEESCCSVMEMSHNDDNDSDFSVNINHTFFETNCCETKDIQIVTDDYQLQQRQQTVLKSQVQQFVNLLFSSVSELLPVNLTNNSFLQKNIPPGGLAIPKAGLLTFICIYRIWLKHGRNGWNFLFRQTFSVWEKSML